MLEEIMERELNKTFPVLWEQREKFLRIDEGEVMYESLTPYSDSTLSIEWVDEEPEYIINTKSTRRAERRKKTAHKCIERKRLYHVWCYGDIDAGKFKKETPFHNECSWNGTNKEIYQNEMRRNNRKEIQSQLAEYYTDQETKRSEIALDEDAELLEMYDEYMNKQATLREEFLAKVDSWLRIHDALERR